MRAKLLFLFICFLVCGAASGQDQQNYAALVKEAEQLYQTGTYKQSAQKYREAFVVLKGKAYPTDRYNAACSYALAGTPDSAFYHLFRLANNSKYSNYNHITIDRDLVSLHKDKRWKKLTATVKANKEKAEANLDKKLVARLDTIYQDDQKTRQQLIELEKTYGWESKEMQAHLQLMREKDSVNVIKVQKILDERGWLGSDIVGQQGNQTLFLVIQHAEQAVQEKYLPQMREAVKKGAASAGSLALLEDRVALRQGKRQIYGSQIGRDSETGELYVLPLHDPDNVDQRRASVGLGPLQDYISNWGLTWDPEAYKKQLPQIEARPNK